MQYFLRIFEMHFPHHLTHFMPLISFDTPWKHQKTRGFDVFRGVSKEMSGMKWVNLRSKFCEEFAWVFHDGGIYHIETSPLICTANQWTGFYMTGTYVMKEFKDITESRQQTNYVLLATQFYKFLYTPSFTILNNRTLV